MIFKWIFERHDIHRQAQLDLLSARVRKYTKLVDCLVKTMNDRPTNKELIEVVERIMDEKRRH